MTGVNALTGDTERGVTAGRGSPEDPVKIAEAARQFEALLIAEMLRSARAGSEGWFGAGEDSSSAPAMGLAEESFSAALAGQGGLGLSSLIVAGLTRSSSGEQGEPGPLTVLPGSTPR
jgi:Rod binding domain-containing protein